MDGKVTKTYWNGAGGYTIVIESGNYTFSYCHSDPNFIVSVGEDVVKGQVIGKVGPKNVYGVPNNPYKDANGNPTNRCNDRVPLPFYSKKESRINKSIRFIGRRNLKVVVIFTGNNEIDRILENEIKGSIIASYQDFIIEDDKFKNQTVILATSAIETDLKEYLFMLRSKDIRVILLLENEKSEDLKIALQSGIYDLVIGNFYPSEIKYILDNPKKFEDIAKLYKRVFDIKIKKKVRGFNR